MGGTNVPKGEARREAILRATLAIIGERGPDAVTHRAVAQRAGLPLSATTYWFASKENLLQETLLLAAREEVERIERVVLDLAPRELDVLEWARARRGAPPLGVAGIRGFILGKIVPPVADLGGRVSRPALGGLFPRLTE